MKNGYARRSCVSERKIRRIVRCFATDSAALQSAGLIGANRNPVKRTFPGPCERPFIACERLRPMAGGVAADESLFGPRRVEGKGGARGKTRVFGIFGRGAFSTIATRYRIAIVVVAQLLETLPRRMDVL